MSNTEKLIKQTQIQREIFTDAIVNHEGIISARISDANTVTWYFDVIMKMLVEKLNLELNK
jgi:hypothetical protein